MFDAFTFYNKVSRIPTDVTNTNHNLHIDIIVDGQFLSMIRPKIDHDFSHKESP